MMIRRIAAASSVAAPILRSSNSSHLNMTTRSMTPYSIRSFAISPSCTIHKNFSSSFIRHFTSSTTAFSSTTSSSSTVSSSISSDDSHSDFAPQTKSRPNTNGIDAAKEQIQKDISTHSIFLYMKGTPQQPRCGFSANVVKILNAYPNIKFGSRDVLEDENIREGIKQFSDWPTLPQLFVNGEFVGGSDIVGNMYKSGELDKLLGASPKGASAAVAK